MNKAGCIGFQLCFKGVEPIPCQIPVEHGGGGCAGVRGHRKRQQKLSAICLLIGRGGAAEQSAAVIRRQIEQQIFADIVPAFKGIGKQNEIGRAVLQKIGIECFFSRLPAAGCSGLIAA